MKMSQAIDRWVVGIVVGTGLLVFGLFFAAAPAMKQVNSAKVFGDDLVEKVCVTWDPKPLEAVASPEFVAHTGTGGIPAMVAAMGRELGPIKHIESTIEGMEGGVAQGGSDPESHTAHYYGEGDFENGPGRIDMTIVKTKGKWTVTRFSGRKL